MRKYGEEFKKSLYLAGRKGPELSSKSFPTLAWTFRLQPVTKGPHYIMLRLESMKICTNYFGKRVSMLLGKDYFGMTTSGYAFSSMVDTVETNYVHVSVSVP